MVEDEGLCSHALHVLLQSDGSGCTLVTDGLGSPVGQDDAELTGGRHARIATLTVADGQRAGLVVPVEGYRGIDAFLVVVVVALVLIERELAVGTGVEADIEDVPSLLPDILHLGA